MSSRTAFRPTDIPGVRLEDRVVLSGGAGGAMGGSVLLRNVRTPSRVVRPARPSVSSLVDVAFDSFQEQFRQVRSTYLASVQAGTATDADRKAFNDYVAQRVDLLAQQVTNSMLVYPKGSSRGNDGSSVLPLMVARIKGDASTDAETGRQTTTLKSSLTSSTPAPGASETTIALASMAQDDAVEASRVSTINGVTIVRNGYFGASRKEG